MSSSSLFYLIMGIFIGMCLGSLIYEAFDWYDRHFSGWVAMPLKEYQELTDQDRVQR